MFEAIAASPRRFSRPRRSPLLSPVALSLALSCNFETSPVSERKPEQTPSTPTTAPPRDESPRSVAGERQTIATGELHAGTHPARFEWRPEIEPLPFRVKLGEYSMDVLPYPNDPSVPPKTTKSLEEAAAWCASQGGRLCTELEWERACRGPEQHAFAGGNSPEACVSPERCTSGFGVRGLGVGPEWTSSRFGATSEWRGQPVLRGKPASSTEREEQRCSLRHAPEASPKEAAVRCCHGAPNAARVQEPEDFPVFERQNPNPDRLRKLLDSDARTAGLAKDLVLFADPEATNTVISRGPGDRKGFDFSTGPLLWSPTLGARFLVVGGKSGKDKSFVLAYHVLPDDEFVLASSYIMDNEVGPVTFAYSESIRPRLHFSTCWGCPGETGKLLFRKPGRVAFLQP